MVALQRQRRARVDMDALDLEAVADHQAFEPAPGPVVQREGFGLGGAFGLQRRHRLFHLLGAGGIGHQHRVGHRHGDDVLQPDAHHFQPRILGPEQRVVAIQRGGRPRHRHAAPVARRLAPDRVPAAEIGPAGGEGHHREIVGPLHHRVIDRDILGPRPGLGRQPEKAQIGLALGQRRLHRGDQAGRIGAEGGEDGLHREQEDAGIPQIAAGGQHLCGAGSVGLFDKAFQRQRPGGEIARILGQFQIAIAGLGPVGADAEGHQPPGAGGLGAGLDRGAEGGGIGHHVIGGRHQHQRLGIAPFQPQRRGQHRRRGVAPLRLDQHRAGIDSRRGQLLGDDEAEIRAGQHQRRGESRPREPRGRGLEQGGFPGQGHKLLGIRLARQRPETRARAAAEKNGCDHEITEPVQMEGEILKRITGRISRIMIRGTRPKL